MMQYLYCYGICSGFLKAEGSHYSIQDYFVFLVVGHSLGFFFLVTF